MTRKYLAPSIFGVLILCSSMARAFELPAICATDPLPDDELTPIADLRKQVEAQAETDPMTAVRLMCMAIPRVEREYGAASPELAWWVGALATPLIAYMNQYAESIPLLEFSQPILERRYGAQAAEVADIHVAYAWIYFRQGKNADAGAAWERALSIREQHPGVRKIELQKVLVGLALVRLNQGDFPRARAALERARDILVENDELVSEAAAAVENVFTNLAFREENFAEAKEHAEAQLRIEKQLQGGIGQLVPAYVFLGQILERLDDFAGSEAASREAIRLAESDDGPLQRHYFTALTQLGTLLNDRGRPNEALAFAQRAVRIGEATLGAEAPRLVKSLQSVADIHRALGKLPEAWHLYERIGEIVEKSRSDIERPTLVAYYRGLAGLQLELGNVNDAVVALDAGLDAASAESSLALQRAYLVATLAQATSRWDLERSTAQLAEALALFESRVPQSHPAILRVINESCALEIKAASRSTPNCGEAKTRVARTREVDPALRAAVFGNLSELAQTRGDFKQAGDLAIAAVAAAEGLGTPDPLWKAYFRTAHVLNERGDARLAIFFGKRSIAQIERQRERFSGEDERFDRGYLRDKVDVYRAVADWLMEAGRIDEGLEVLRLLKAEELYEFVARDAAWNSTEAGPDLDPDEQRLSDRYPASPTADDTASEDIERLSRLRDKDRLTEQERKRLESLLRRHGGAEAARAKRIRKFVAENGGVSDTSRQATHPIQAARLKQQLQHAPPNSVIAVYFLAEDRLRILIATRTSQSELRLSVDSARLRRDIGRFIESVGKRQDVSNDSRALYELIGRPLDELARREKITHVTLWLDGALRYVPFGALLSQDGYLGDRYAIQMLAAHDRDAASALAPKDRLPSVRGFGVTQAVAGYRALPAMADELCYIVHGPIAGLLTTSTACSEPAIGTGALAGEGFADAEFTAQRLQTALTAPHAFSVLHLGTHFSLRPGNAMRSYLVLGDGSRLMLDTLSTFDFTGLDLVTLSACQTALGGARTDDGREIDGLHAIVQQRGARRVIASLWRVDDASTAQLMRAMYNTLATKPDDIAAALQDAQRAVRSIERNGRRPYEHPYYWAGFVLSGSGAL